MSKTFLQHLALAPGRLLLGLLALLALSGPALAETPSAAEARAVRQVIEAQLQALAADDAVRAFLYASAAIRSQFGDANAFMTMVRQAYPMVIRPAATAFYQPERVDGAVLQVVQLRDADGHRWLATYQMVRQLDARQVPGPWRINGCAVVPDGGKSST